MTALPDPWFIFLGIPRPGGGFLPGEGERAVRDAVAFSQGVAPPPRVPLAEILLTAGLPPVGLVLVSYFSLSGSSLFSCPDWLSAVDAAGYLDSAWCWSIHTERGRSASLLFRLGRLRETPHADLPRAYPGCPEEFIRWRDLPGDLELLARLAKEEEE